ncbi:SLAM family member 6 [Pseudorasbora parva]|uniref:SLAM family member 6 n=1 Tax=Pseudorasbora parva TaxID=51549 RepID=UPI00351F275D
MKLILLCIFGFSLDFAAECQQNHYGLKGKSIHLSISSRNQSHQIADVVWRRFDRKDLLANSKRVNPNFEEKMELESDYSLTIHNLQENDSGLYEALTDWETKQLAAFLLKVENTVSEPVIKVSPHDVNSSLCGAAVNCSVDGSWASYDCDRSVCAETHSSLSSININLTVLDSGFRCHASNHVSKSHSQTSDFMCHEKLQRDVRSPPTLLFWIAVAAGVGVALGLLMGLIAVIVKKRKTSKVHPQSSHVVTARNTVIEQHHETIYSTVNKPVASQNPPGNHTDSSAEGTIYDTPTRHPKVRQVNSVTVMIDNQERQRAGSDRTVQVQATVHQADEPDSEQINTVYCKLGEI